MSKTITHAIRIHETGPASVMKLEQVELGEYRTARVIYDQVRS